MGPAHRNSTQLSTQVPCKLHASVWVGSRLGPDRVWRRQGTALCPAGPGEALARDFLVVPAAGLRSRTLKAGVAGLSPILESGQRRFSLSLLRPRLPWEPRCTPSLSYTNGSLAGEAHGGILAPTCRQHF